MPRHADRKTPSGDSSTFEDCREVGKVTLGDRCFVIYSSSDRVDFGGIEKACRFEIGGVDLFALERPCAAKQEIMSSDDIATKLTGRELQIAVLVARGLATKNIAHKLQISEWTVATYLRRIFAKLDVYSRAAMVYRCASLIDRTADFLDYKSADHDADFCRLKPIKIEGNKAALHLRRAR